MCNTLRGCLDYWDAPPSPVAVANEGLEFSGIPH